MAIVAGTPIQLADGRKGVVIPSAYRGGRLRIKVTGGHKVWAEEEQCTPIYERKENVNYWQNKL